MMWMTPLGELYLSDDSASRDCENELHVLLR